MRVGEAENTMKLVEEIKRGHLPVIIYGAGIVAEALYHACGKYGIKVECFCDNNINKIKNTLFGLNIIHTPRLKEQYNDARILISSADIKDVLDQLKVLGYTKWYPATGLLKDFDVYQYKFSSPNDFVEYAVNTGLLCHDSYLNPDKLFMRSVDIVITERCSLKCRDCSNLMQYYQKPDNCSNEEIQRTIDAFCGVMDEVNEFRVIGGEPFMNKDFDLIIKRLINEPKVKRIVIYTNGTIIPSEEKLGCLKDKKVLLIITDYGKLSRKLSDLTDYLKKNSITYFAPKARGWTDCSKIVKHNRTVEGQKEIFRNCCAKNSATLLSGKLYRCPFAANADRLKAVPDCESDHIDLFAEASDKIDITALKKKIRDYLLTKEYLETCDYCNGRSFNDSEIQPAIQLEKPLEYKKAGSGE